MCSACIISVFCLHNFTMLYNRIHILYLLMYIYIPLHLKNNQNKDILMYKNYTYHLELGTRFFLLKGVVFLYKCISQALISFKKYMPPSSSLLQGKHLPFTPPPPPHPHFASIFFAYLWSFRWPNYIITLPRYFSFRLPHLNINTGPPSDELDKNIQRKSHFLFFSQWNGYSHFRSVLNWFRD